MDSGRFQIRVMQSLAFANLSSDQSRNKETWRMKFLINPLYWVLGDVLTKLQNDLDEDIFINIKMVKAPGPATYDDTMVWELQRLGWCQDLDEGCRSLWAWPCRRGCFSRRLVESKDKILKEDNPELLDRVHLESEIVTMVKISWRTHHNWMAISNLSETWLLVQLIGKVSLRA